MKKFLFLLTFICPHVLLAQQFSWVQHNPVQYTMNPTYVHTELCKGPGNSTWLARLDSSAVVYGTDLYGPQVLENRDASGNLLNTLTLGSEVFIDDIITDANGHLYIAGSFFNTLAIGNLDTLTNSLNGLNSDPFLICIHSNGSLLWKRNLTAIPFNSYRITRLAVSPAGDVHYALNNWSWCSIVKLDASGQDLSQVMIDGAKTIGDMDFDPWGNIFVTGATGNNNFTIGNYSIMGTEQYLIYIARINTNGEASWVHLGHDVTVQFPSLTTDGLGNAYVAATLMDTLTWGSFHLDGPDWVYDYWLVKVDSNGTFLWAKENLPIPGGINGDFQQGKSHFIESDAAGNVMMTGAVRGSVDWGNNVVVTNTPVSQSNLHAVLFDPNGLAQWTKTIQGSSFKEIHNIIHMNGDWYISGIHNNASNVLFDTLTVNFSDPQNCYLTKIEIPSTTGFTQDELSVKKAFIFPNPATDEVRIPGNLTNGKTVELMTADGKLLRRFTPSGNSITVKDIPAGLYLLRFEGQVLKLIKE